MSSVSVTSLLMIPAALLLLSGAPITTAASAEETPILVEARGNRQMQLVIELPRPAASASPAAARELADVLSYDLNMSGTVRTEVREPLFSRESSGFGSIDYNAWSSAGTDLLVRGEYTLSGQNLTVEFRLYGVGDRSTMASKRYLGSPSDLRRFAHSFASEILLALTGERGCFTSRLAFVSTQTGNKEIAAMDWDGKNRRQITANGSINLNPDFSPDGTQLLFTSYKRGNPDIYRRPLSTAAEIPVSQRKGLNITGAWSPDGKSIALTLSKDGNSEIYTVSARDGSSPARLTTAPSIEVSPSWTPDGRRLAFVSDRLGKPQVFLMDASGANVRRLTTSGSYNVTPRWSPKGDRIVYARMTGGGFQIFSIRPDGSDDTQLTSSGSNENPVWSPDGRFIAFASKRGGAEAIYVMRADGSGQTRVGEGKGASSQPAWSAQ